MLGAITGDIIGSIYEGYSIKTAFYQSVPEAIATQALAFLDEPLRRIAEIFMAKYGCR
jgi:hypothetical protein